jgi:hypothetical protein
MNPILVSALRGAARSSRAIPRSAVVINAVRAPSTVISRVGLRYASASESANPTTSALPDAPPSAAPIPGPGDPMDWSTSFHGLSSTPFPKEVAEVLMAEVNPDDVEIKPGMSTRGFYACNRVY